MKMTGGDDKYLQDECLRIGADVLVGVCLFLGGAVFGFAVYAYVVGAI